jgi:hypothetical protein
MKDEHIDQRHAAAYPWRARLSWRWPAAYPWRARLSWRWLISKKERPDLFAFNLDSTSIVERSAALGVRRMGGQPRGRIAMTTLGGVRVSR